MTDDLRKAPDRAGRGTMGRKRNTSFLDGKGVILLPAVVKVAAAFYLFIASPFLAAAAPDPCAEARELYAAGVAAIDPHARVAAFQKAVELCPSFAEAHVNLADAFENLNDLASAEVHYKKAIDLGLKSPIPHVGLGEVYLRDGRYELAADAFRKGLEFGDDLPRLQTGLRAALERIQREKELLKAEEIQECLMESEAFRLLCMCPTEEYGFLRKWICFPVLFFRTGVAVLSSRAEEQLAELGTALNSDALASRTITVRGHADSFGTDAANDALARRRANVVKWALVKKYGVHPSRVKVAFFGSKLPRATNTTSAGRAQNRRVEIVLDQA